MIGDIESCNVMSNGLCTTHNQDGRLCRKQAVDEWDRLRLAHEDLKLQVSEANEKGYQRAWKEIREQREGLKARCVEKCSHPADFVCDYEDGTSHCLHCLMDKVWEEEAKAADKPEEGCAHRIVVEVPLPEWKKDHIRAVDEQGREKRISEPGGGA